MLTREDGRFVGSLEVRNVALEHRFTEDEQLRLLRIAGYAYDGSRVKLSANDISYLCMNVRFNYAKECHRDDSNFDHNLFNHLQVVK